MVARSFAQPVWAVGRGRGVGHSIRITHSHGRVKRFHGSGSDETIHAVQEATFSGREDRPKRTPSRVAVHDQQWSWIMSAILTLIYREYCKARLAEISKANPASPEVNGAAGARTD